LAVETGVISPPIVEWTLGAKAADRTSDRWKTGDVRVFYQSELTIDGEVALLSLVSRSVASLADQNFPLTELGNLQKEDGQLDVALAGRLASQASPIVPNLAAESCAILFGYYPADDFGRRSTEYDDTVAFIRSAITVPRWMDVINIFLSQNDWQRMSNPFAEALKKGVQLGLWAERAKAEALKPGSPTT
jgi:hypothetical protein